jgi:hypothetical protein
MATHYSQATEDPLLLEMDDVLPQPTLSREMTDVGPPSPHKKGKKRKPETQEVEEEEEKKSSSSRKSRVLMEKEEAFTMISPDGSLVLTPDAKGKYDSYKMRTFVVSLRKQKFAMDDSGKVPEEIKVVLGDSSFTLPLHGRNAKRTPGIAKTRAFTILDTLRKHGVINGRYVSVLRDFGYGGNSANKLVKDYTARGKGLVKVEEAEDDMDSGSDKEN